MYPSVKRAAAAVSQIQIGNTGRPKSHAPRVIWFQEVFSNMLQQTTELTHLIRSDKQPVTEDQDQLNQMYIDVAAVARRVREAKDSRDLYLHEQVIVLNCQQCRLPAQSTCGDGDQVSAGVYQSDFAEWQLLAVKVLSCGVPHQSILCQNATLSTFGFTKFGMLDQNHACRLRL